jgi:purine-binding chemotaxis protein CheW
VGAGGVDYRSTVTAVCLICRVGARLCAIPVGHVGETMRPLPIEPFAGAPPFVLGASIIRGVPTPVVDAARLLGSAAAEPATRFVTIRAGERPVALAVHEILGVDALPASHELPPLLGDASADTVATLGTLDSKLLVVLSSARIVEAAR